MNRIHDLLSLKFAWYSDWHKNPKNSFVHWLAFLIITFVFAYNSLSNVGRLHELENEASLYGTVTEETSPRALKPRIAQDHILVKFKEKANSSKKSEILAKHKLKEIEEISQIKVKIVAVSEDDTAQEVVDRLNSDEKDNVEFAELDMLLPPGFTPNDPSFINQWERVKVGDPRAWDITKGSPSVIVAIADTGVDCAHPELAANCIAGWNFYDNNSDARDVYGHGTKTAGTAAAMGNNAAGVAGQAWAVKIMPLRVSGIDGYASFSAIASAVTYAADHGAKVVNNSYQTSGSASIQQAGQYLKNKGGLLTVSEGNYGADKGTAQSQSLISVSGTDPNDILYSWSSFGNDTDVAAPGCVYTTLKGGSTGSGCGTSFAAPMVAGTLALIFSANPALTPSQAEAILFTTAKDLGTAGWDKYFGWGRIDAGAAVLTASNASTSPSVPDTLPPSAPAGLKTTTLTYSKVGLSWLASTDNDKVAGYKVFRNNIEIGTVTSPYYDDTSVSPSATYSYMVKAFDPSGNLSASSNILSVTTPPVTISILSSQVSDKTPNSAKISWTTNISSTGSVLYGTSSSNLSLSSADNTTGTSHFVTLSGLTKGTTYYYKIITKSADGVFQVTSNVSSFKTTRR